MNTKTLTRAVRQGIERKSGLPGIERKGRGDEEQLNEIFTLIKEQGETLDARFKRLEEDAATDRKELDRILLRANRPGVAGNVLSQRSPGEQKALEDGIRALLTGNQALAMQRFHEAKAMEAGTDPAGGYLTIPEFSTEMTRVMADISPFNGLARTVNLKHGDTLEEPVDRNQAETAWVGETTPSPRNETATPDLGQFKVSTCELVAYPKVTQKLLDIAEIDVMAWLRGKVAEAFGVAEGSAFHNGDGVARPRGFLTYANVAVGDATRTWGQIEYVPTGAGGAFATATTTVSPADVLKATIGKLRVPYRKNARWLMNRGTAAIVQTFKDTVGRFLWVDSLTPGQPDMLCGYPVEIDESMPDIAANSYSIAFGDFQKAYTIVRRLGVRFLVDPYTAPPHVKLLTYERVGGGVNNTEALKLIKFAVS